MFFRVELDHQTGMCKYLTEMHDRYKNEMQSTISKMEEDCKLRVTK